MTPDILAACEVPGFLDFVLSLFAAVPAGFLLGMLLGVLSCAIFSVVRLRRATARP